MIADTATRPHGCPAVYGRAVRPAGPPLASMGVTTPWVEPGGMTRKEAASGQSGRVAGVNWFPSEVENVNDACWPGPRWIVSGAPPPGTVVLILVVVGMLAPELLNIWRLG